MAYQPYQPKNPALAAILSFLIPGIGQIYNGEIGKGLAIIGIQIVNGLLMLIVVGFFTAPLVLVWSVYDAYKTAEKINGQTAQQVIADTKVCPRCAERVNNGARVCHHCGYEFMPAQPLLAATPVALLPPVVSAPPVAAAVAGAAKYCENCGKQVKADARFCQYCGYRFEEAARTAPVEVLDAAASVEEGV